MSTTSSQESPEQRTWRRRAVDYFTKRGRLELAVGMLGLDRWREENRQDVKNREAEDGFVRKAVWGYDNNDTAEEMGDMYLGDVYPQMPQRPNGSLKTLATIVLGGALALGTGGAGIATGMYLLDKLQPDKTPADTDRRPDETVRIGLGKLDE